jgi:TonB family protein
LYRAISSKISPPKENVFRVKLGGKELSTGPNVGKPERLRPRNTIEDKAVAKEIPSVPVEPTLPKTEVKQITKVPQVKEAKPLPKPKKVVKNKAKVKPKVKAKPTKKTKKIQPTNQAKVNKPTKAKNKVTKKTNKNQRKKPKNTKDAQSQVYRPPSGRNTNLAVPIGNKDAGQVKGPVTSKLPGGGQQVAIERYARALGIYLKSRWNEPPKSLLQGSLPQTVVALTIASDGRIVEYKITSPSGNEAMDNSVILMLRNLDRVPVPPNGNLAIEIVMQVED